jgi:hypothetical protein
LQNELPQCTINYNDEHPPAPELKEKWICCFFFETIA